MADSADPKHDPGPLGDNENVSLAELNDSFSSLLPKIKKHIAQEQDAFALVIENAKIIADLRQQRALRERAESQHRATLQARFCELVDEISASRKTIQRLESEVRSAKAALRRRSELAKQELQEKMKKFEDTKIEITMEMETQKAEYQARIDQTLKEIETRRQAAMRQLEERSDHERCAEKLTRLREGHERRLHGLNAEIASYKADIHELRLRINNLKKQRDGKTGRGRPRPPQVAAEVNAHQIRAAGRITHGWRRRDAISTQARTCAAVNKGDCDSPLELAEVPDSEDAKSTSLSSSQSSSASDLKIDAHKEPAERAEAHVVACVSPGLARVDDDDDDDTRPSTSIVGHPEHPASPDKAEDVCTKGQNEGHQSSPTQCNPSSPERFTSVGMHLKQTRHQDNANEMTSLVNTTPEKVQLSKKIEEKGPTELQTQPKESRSLCKTATSGRSTRRSERRLFRDPNPAVSASPPAKKPKKSDKQQQQQQVMSDYLEGLRTLVTRASRRPTQKHIGPTTASKASNSSGH